MLSDVFRTADHALELLLHRAASVNPWLCALGMRHSTSWPRPSARAAGTRSCAPPTRTPRTSSRATRWPPTWRAPASTASSRPAAATSSSSGSLHRRIPDARYPTLAATFVPETLFETLFGFGLVVWALSRGFLPVPTSSGELPHVDVTLVIEHPFLSVGAVAVGAVASSASVRAAAPPDLRPRRAPAPGRRDPAPAAPLRHRRGVAGRRSAA